MPNILILSLDGFVFSSRQLYEELLPKLLSRAIVHESCRISDALAYIQSGWPSTILVTDGVIAKNNPDSKLLREAVATATQRGCTTILMSFFPSSVEPEDLNVLLQEGFGLRWEAAMVAVLETILSTPDPNLISRKNLTPLFRYEAAWLRRVPPTEAVYIAMYNGSVLAHSALGRVGLGKLGYVGDVNFTNEAEQLILAMCHLDRDEQAL